MQVTSSTFYADGHRDGSTGEPSSPPDVPVYAAEYQAGYADAGQRQGRLF